MRIACYSPLPPERSGIADYTFELLEQLREHLDVTAVVSDLQLGNVRAPEGVPIVGFSDSAELDVDVNLYQMGNNSRYHRFFFGRTFEDPGLLVMHDPSLGDFMAELCGGAESAIFRDEVAYDSPDLPPEVDLPLVDVGNGRKDLDRLRVLLARRIVESNIRTLVHSSAIEHEMRRRYPLADIQTIQLPAPLLHAQPRRAGDQPMVFGVFGGINYYKRIRPLVDAFLDVASRHRGIRMVIAGRADDKVLERELRALASGLDGVLEIATNLSLSDLEAAMLACDVGITLRWPTAGEMSATLMRTLGAGRPAIVSDVLQFRELDERFCWRVTTDFDAEHGELVALMEALATDPERCRTAGIAARRFVEQEATYDVVAHHYVEHLEHCARFRTRRQRVQSPLSLDQDRPLGLNIWSLRGPSEVATAASRTAAALRRAGLDVVHLEMDPILEDRRQDVEIERTSRALDRVGTAREAADRDGRYETEDRALAAVFLEDRHRIAEGPYPFDLLFVEAGEAVRFGSLARVRRGRGHRVVPMLSPGIAPLTPAHRLLLEVAEAIVVPSTHSADVVALSTEVPISVVGWPVETVALAPRASRAVELLTIVRARQPVAATNPFGALEVFRRAFAYRERRDAIRFTVVFEGADERPEAAESLGLEAASVGAHLVVEPDAERLVALRARASIYLSAHRALGFGLDLADAAASGCSVLATGYSGPNDYVERLGGRLFGYETALLDPIDFYLDPGAEGDAIPGSLWAEPDLESAARRLHRLVDEARPGLRHDDDTLRTTQLAPDAVASRLLEVFHGLGRRAPKTSDARTGVVARR